MTDNIGISPLEHVSEKESIEDDYPNFNDKFNSDILDLLGVVPVGNAILFGDVGYDPPHWEGVGRIPPQG